MKNRKIRWRKLLDYSSEKIQAQNQSLNPLNIFAEGETSVFNMGCKDEYSLTYTDKFKKKIFLYANIEINDKQEFYYDVFWGWGKSCLFNNSEDVEGFFTKVIKPFQLNQYWRLFYHLAPKTWYNGGKDGILGDLSDSLAPYTYIRVVLPSGEKTVITMRPYTRGDFTEGWIGILIDCVDEKTLTSWGDFTFVKLFSLRT